MIKAVTFDLWNTILCDRHYSNYRIDVLAEVLEDKVSPRDKTAVKNAYFCALKLSSQAWQEEQRYISTQKLTEFMLRNLNVSLPTESKRMIIQRFQEAALRDPPALMRHAERVLVTLFKSYTIGLISNSGITPGRILRRVLKNHAVLQYFMATVFSDEVGYHKPHPSIFRTALRNLEVKPEEVIHIGDLLESDVAGAKAMGIKTVWFNIHGKKRPGVQKFSPDYEIRALPQLLRILDKS